MNLQEQIAVKLASLGYCRALHARISAADCAALKNRKGNISACEEGPPQCATCSGLVASPHPIEGESLVPAQSLQTQVGSKPEAAEFKEELTMQKTEQNTENKNITIASLARDTGLDYRRVWAIFKLHLAGKKSSGDGACKIQEYFDQEGLGWDNVLTPNARGKAAQAPTLKQQANLPAPEMVALFKPAKMKWMTNIPAPEMAVNPQNVDPLPMPQPDSQIKLASLQNLPLEDLLAELVRRLPRAEIILR